MFVFTFLKVSLKGRVLTFVGVPPMVMVAVVIIIKVARVVAVIITVVMAAAVVMAPGKGSGENPEKSSPRRKGGLPSGFLMQKGARMGVISTPIDILPA